MESVGDKKAGLIDKPLIHPALKYYKEYYESGSRMPISDSEYVAKKLGLLKSLVDRLFNDMALPPFEPKEIKLSRDEKAFGKKVKDLIKEVGPLTPEDIRTILEFQGSLRELWRILILTPRLLIFVEMDPKNPKEKKHVYYLDGQYDNAEKVYYNPQHIPIIYSKVRGHKDFLEFIKQPLERILNAKVIRNEHGPSEKGVDLLLIDKDGKIIGIQCEYQRSKRADVKTIRKLLACKHEKKVAVSNSRFTDEALKEAEEYGIETVDCIELIRRLYKIGAINLLSYLTQSEVSE